MGTPKGMTDTQFINRLIKSANSYQNNLNYDLYPKAGTNGYNSNSYVSGVIKAAGDTPPALNANGEFQAPGYEKPIPLNTGGHQVLGVAAQAAHGAAALRIFFHSASRFVRTELMPTIRSSK